MKLVCHVIFCLLLLPSFGALVAQEDQSIVRVSSDVAGQNLLKRVEPYYPQMAKIAHVQGDVILRIIISPEGKVISLKAVSGHPILIQAALDAVKQWEYRPFILNGNPARVETTVLVPFSLGMTEAEAKRLAAAAEKFYGEEDKCRNLLSQHEYSAAENTCISLIPLASNLDSWRHLERIKAYQLAGHALIQQQKFQGALDDYQHELLLAQKTLHPFEAELGYAYRDVAVGLLATGDLNQADSYYQQAEGTLEQAREHIDSAFLKNKYSQTIKSVLQDHALLLRKMGKDREAEVMEKKAESIVVRTDLKDD